MNTPEGEETVFAEALRLPPEERAAYLAQATKGNDALRQRVESLLGSYQAGDFLEAAAAPQLRPTPQITIPLTEKPGDRIGRYKLLEQIGEGGCGVVYVAEQTEPVRRRVALKIIKLGMDTKSVIARFEAERQVLALMDHPNIAKVLDAGATETGRPYFVMELVRGMKITDFCDEKKLSTNGRLDLFIQVCQAIQHAHQKGIIHRDIKPSNILVTVNDGVPIPKVIDFGVAKATGGQHLTNKTIYTAFEQFIGTPAYMSPEQAVLTSLDIDTRSDIYALGVLLYELLTGKTPFDPKELLAIGLDEMRRTIREKEPDRPSTRVSTLPGQELSTTAQRRGLEAPKLVSELRGDLDWIVMKCLEKDRARRYETANGLALDIERHLDNEPVMACPPSSLYRFQKLVRRNKLAFAAVGAVITALILGMGTSTWMFLRERKALRRAVAAEQAQTRLRQEAEAARGQAQADAKKAQSEAARRQQVAQFLQDMLAGVGPSVALGRDTTMLREILDKTAERVGKELANQPDVEIEIRLTLADVYAELGLNQQEEQMARESVRLARSMPGGESENLARSLEEFGRALGHLGNYEEAENLERQALAMQRKLRGSDSREVANSLVALGVVLWRLGKLDEAEAKCREALKLRRQLPGNELEVSEALNDLALVLAHCGRLIDAENMYRQALEINRKLLGDEHPLIATANNNLAVVLMRQGNLTEAETLHRDALKIGRKLLGDEHQAVVLYLHFLGDVLARQGKWKEAADCWASLIQRDPTDHMSHHSLAPLLAASGDLDRYRDLCKEIVTRFGDTTDPFVSDRMTKDCSMLPSSGTDPEVVAKMAEAAAAAGPTDRHFTYFQCTKGMAEYRQGHFADALTFEDKTIAIREDPGDYLGHDTLYVEAYAVSAMAHFQLQQTDEARAALARANVIAARLPKLESGDIGGSWRDWIIAHKLLDEATALIADGSKINMEQMLDDLLSKAPDNRELLSLRADYRALHGRWTEAAADLIRATQQPGDKPQKPVYNEDWHKLATLLVQTGDPTRYRQQCQWAVQQFGNTRDVATAHRISKDCLILPDSGVDLSIVSQLADFCVAGEDKRGPRASTKALAEYRQGRFASAADWAQETLAHEARPGWVTVQTSATLAMARHKLKQSNLARVALTRAQDEANKYLPSLDSADVGSDFLDVIISHALLREAEAMIQDGSVTNAEAR